MTRPARAKTTQLFEREVKLLKESKAILGVESKDAAKIRHEMSVLVGHYEDLLDQSKLITKVSDRLQKKIIRATTAEEEKNAELHKTIDALTKAKVGRKAATMTLGIAVGLFLVGEGLLEPQIDKWVANSSLAQYRFDNVNLIGLGLKGLIAILIRPIEKIVQKRMMDKAMKEKALEVESNKK